MTFVPTRLAGGVWEGVVSAPTAPRLTATHQGRAVPGVEVAPGRPGEWLVRVPVPPEAVSDGVHTVVVAEEATGEALGSFAIVAGEALALDLRAEIDLLRAELDMLKRAFRRHCVEGGA